MSYLFCVIDAASGENSVFKVLSGEELRNTSLRQNPELLKFAARTGETVRIAITAAEQGAVIQEGVTAVLDCSPWLRTVPGGTVRWYKYSYYDLDHTRLGKRYRQTPEMVDSEMVDSPRASITGDLEEIFTIIDSVIDMYVDYSRGIYECEVCVDNHQTNCTSANTTSILSLSI